MYTIRPEIVSAEGNLVYLQSVEITEDFVLLRLREGEPGSLRKHDRPSRTVETERFTLRVGNGEPVPMSHSVSTGEGPFLGITDLAFPKSAPLNLEETFTLASQNCRIDFRI